VRVIVDTNVLVSGLISATGAPGKVVDAIVRGDIIPVMSPATFAELEDVLHRPQLQRFFRRAKLTPFQFLSELHTVVEITIPRKSGSRIRDDKDRAFIDLAATRPPVDFLVTGDKDFDQTKYEDVTVISAMLFAELLARTRTE
jgi:putative PIN family toxin of toxin-antitoxin system